MKMRPFNFLPILFLTVIGCDPIHYGISPMPFGEAPIQYQIHSPTIGRKNSIELEVRGQQTDSLSYHITKISLGISNFRTNPVKLNRSQIFLLIDGEKKSGNDIQLKKVKASIRKVAARIPYGSLSEPIEEIVISPGIDNFEIIVLTYGCELCTTYKKLTLNIDGFSDVRTKEKISFSLDFILP